MLSWFKKRSRDPKQAIKEALGDYELPTFPAVVTETLAKLRDPNADLKQIAATLAADPGTSAKVLGLANSPAYALRNEVRNLDHAVALLGRGQTESLLLAVAAREALPQHSLSGYDPRGFWRAAACRATAATALAARLHPATKSECFTAALLQDMAIPLLRQQRGELYGEVLERWHAGEAELADLEHEELGLDHAEVAGWMCRAWQFPYLIADAIGAHHEDASSAHEVPPAVQLVAPLGDEDEQSRRQVAEEVSRRYGLAHDEVLELLDRAFENASSLSLF